jgi:hypothetical protein
MCRNTKAERNSLFRNEVLLGMQDKTRFFEGNEVLLEIVGQIQVFREH